MKTSEKKMLLDLTTKKKRCTQMKIRRSCTSGTFEIFHWINLYRIQVKKQRRKTKIHCILNFQHIYYLQEILWAARLIYPAFRCYAADLSQPGQAEVTHASTKSRTFSTCGGFGTTRFGDML